MAKVLFVICVPVDNDVKSSFENEEICKEEKGSQELKCTNGKNILHYSTLGVYNFLFEKEMKT